MSVPEGEDADDAPLTLAPPDPEVPATRTAAVLPRFEPAAASRRAADRLQFTLGQVLIANSVLAVILALGHWMAPSLVAGTLGLLAFGLFLYVTIYQPQQPGMYSLAWMLIAIYALAATVALVCS
jgi:hypothetical protein